MTCKHALDLIDAGPLVDVSDTQQEAAESHVAACPTCGPAAAAARVVETRLRELGSPTAPPDLSPAVMARIARLDLPATRAADVQAVGHRSTKIGWVEWVAALCMAAGLAVVVTATSLPWLTDGLGASGVPPPLLQTLPLVVGTVGVGCYLLGLLLPVARRWRT